MFNPSRLLKLKSMKEDFERRHPKVFPFLQTVSQRAIVEGSVIEVTVTCPDGSSYCSNIKLTDKDLEMLEQLKKLH